MSLYANITKKIHKANNKKTTRCIFCLNSTNRSKNNHKIINIYLYIHGELSHCHPCHIFLYLYMNVMKINVYLSQKTNFAKNKCDNITNKKHYDDNFNYSLFL